MEHFYLMGNMLFQETLPTKNSSSDESNMQATTDNITHAQRTVR